MIVNASASSVTARTRVVIQKALSADHDLSVAVTSRRGHATRLAQGAAADGVELVVVLGGDGTLNEAANGLARSGTALGVLPGGSTNVFARSIGVANDPVEATGQLLAALARDSVRPVNLGSVNGRYFLFHVGVGYDAVVVAQVERRAALKRYAGHPLFAWSAVATWARHYDRRRPHFRVEVPGVPAVDDAYFTVCLNSDPYTFLRDRPFRVVPGTGLDTDLGLATFRTMDFVPFVPLVADALAGGRRLRRHRQISIARDVAAAVVTGYGPVPYQVDGDYLGTVDRLELCSEPAALRLVVP